MSSFAKLQESVRRRCRSLVCLAGLSLVFGTQLGCATRPAARFAHTAQILQRLQQRTSCSRAVQGEAKLVVKAPLFRRQGNLLFRAHAPDHLRLDLYSPFGVTLSTLTTSGEELSLYEPHASTMYTGRANACSVQRFAGVAIPSFALVEILRGRPPVIDFAQARLRLKGGSPAGARYTAQLASADGTKERLEFFVPREDFQLPLEQQRVFLSRVRVKQHRSLLYDVHLSDYRAVSRRPLSRAADEMGLGQPRAHPTGPACEAELPFSFVFSVGRPAVSLSVRAEELEHNPPEVLGVYTQTPTPGVRRVPVDCTAP